ncbi:MAG: hypothetical protein IJ213_09900 [Bacteroidales bacterium]|nr:hypothetical protein [Bacteroidales bacterium]
MFQQGKDSYLFPVVFKYLLLFWTVVVFVLLLLPQSSFAHAPRFPFLAFLRWKHMDKVVHFIMFFIESWLLFRHLEFSKKFSLKKLSFITILSIFSLGLFTEVLQEITYNTAKRNFSLADLFFDTLASICVVIIINQLYKRKKKTNLLL